MERLGARIEGKENNLIEYYMRFTIFNFYYLEISKLPSDDQFID